jgi:hypothetical protein
MKQVERFFSEEERMKVTKSDHGKVITTQGMKDEIERVLREGGHLNGQGGRLCSNGRGMIPIPFKGAKEPDVIGHVTDWARETFKGPRTITFCPLADMGGYAVNIHF